MKLERKRFNFAHSLFNRIAEPRIIRLMQFGVYFAMIFAGIGIIVNPPRAFESILGSFLVYTVGIFISSGAFIGFMAVLPGIWWLERAGILALTTGLTMYAVVVIALGSSILGIAVAVAFILTFFQRWTEIKGAQLAPREE